MPVRVRDVYELLNQLAPFETQEAWDNAGLLAGSTEQVVTGIILGLDLSMALIEEAKDRGANLIITHHPILFRGRKNLREDDIEGRMLCELVRGRIALIAAHTNFDNASPGVNDALSQRLGLTEVVVGESGMRIGTPRQKTIFEFKAHAQSVLGAPIRCYESANPIIKRVALLGGSGGDYAPLAAASGADVYLTGEIAYHSALTASMDGMHILEAGHDATELPAIHLLCKALQTAADAVEWNLRIELGGQKPRA